MRRLQTRTILWVIIALTIAIFPQLLAMPVHLIPLTLLPLVWRLVGEMRQWKPLPALARLAITLLTVTSLVVTYGGLMGRRAAVSLLTLMLALKLLETYKVRDARIVVSLALFLCTTQFLFNQGMGMLVYGIASVLSGLMALVHLHREEAFSPVDKTPATGLSLFSEVGFGARLLAISMPAALLIFLFFPRWGSPLWGVPEAALDARSGLSDSMEPGSIQSLFMDDTPAFRVEFEGNAPPHSELYWRGPVFWHFDGRRWDGSFYGRNVRATRKPLASESVWRYRIQMEPTEQHWLFALDYPALIPRGARLTIDYQLYSRRAITQLRSYVMASDPRFVDSPELLHTMRAAGLDVPDGYNPRTRELMAEWRAAVPDDRDLVREVLQHFNQEQFHYTLNPPLLSRHSVDEFIFDTRSGFCEHYASAFTQMMRMAGIPARVVTGYQGGWYSDFGQYVLVRQSDAHAWSEVWLEGSGWVRVDPTAAVSPSRVERGALDALGARRHMLDYEWLMAIRNGFDLIRRGWNEWVIAFSTDSQNRLLQAFGWNSVSPRVLVIIMIIGLVVLSALLAPFILRMRTGGHTDPALKLWSRFQRKLSKTGLKTGPSTGPLELVSLAVEQDHQDVVTIGDVAGLYTQYRYAPDPPGVEALKRAVNSYRPKRKPAA